MSQKQTKEINLSWVDFDLFQLSWQSELSNLSFSCFTRDREDLSGQKHLVSQESLAQVCVGVHHFVLSDSQSGRMALMTKYEPPVLMGRKRLCLRNAKLVAEYVTQPPIHPWHIHSQTFRSDLICEPDLRPKTMHEKSQRHEPPPV